MTRELTTDRFSTGLDYFPYFYTNSFPLIKSYHNPTRMAKNPRLT